MHIPLKLYSALAFVGLVILSSFPFHSSSKFSPETPAVVLPDQTLANPASTPATIQNGEYKSYLPLIEKGRAFYVSPSGSDANPGTLTQPWKTIKKAASVVLPGDTVYVRGGVYTETVVISRSGSAENPIQFLAYQGEKPVVDGNYVRPGMGNGLINLDGDWIILVGFEVLHSQDAGVKLYGRHNTARNIYAHHNRGAGILIQGDYGTVENSQIWRNSFEENGSPRGGTGLSAARDEKDGITDYAVMRGNIIWENGGEGLSSFQANQILMEGNISHDNMTVNIYISDSTNVLCQRNFVYNTPGFTIGDRPAVGIGMGDEKQNPASSNITIINNIAYGNNHNYWWWQGASGWGMNNVLIANNTFVNSTDCCSVIIDNYQGAPISNVRFQNNIVEQDNSLAVINVWKSAGLTFSNNLWSKTPWSVAAGQGDVVAAPGLVKSGSPDDPDWFKLTASSAAINKALSLPNVLVDYFGNSRGNAPDIGAAEYVSGK